MISERFDLRCPADGVYLHDYLLSRKTGQLRNTAAFFRRASSEADVLSYKPIHRSYAAVSEDNRNPFLSPVLIGGPRGFNFRAALFGDLGTTSSSSPINPASSPFSRRTQSRETAEASFVTSPPSAPSSIAAFGPERTPVSTENTPDTPQHPGLSASRTTHPPAGGGNQTDINRPEPLDFDFIGGAFDAENQASPTEVSNSTSALPLQTRGDVVLEYKHYNNPPYATFGTRLTQSMVVSKRLRGHTGCINSIEYNDDASLLITGSDDLKIKIYDTTSWKHLTTVTTQHAANIFSAIMVPNSCNNKLISCGLDGGICVSDIITNSSSLVHRYRFVMATKLMPLPEWGSGHVALCGFESGDIAFIDTRTKTLPHKAALFHSKGQATHRIPINGIAAHPHNPNIFAFASDIPFAQLCDIRYLANTSIEQCKPRCAFSEVGVVTNRFRNRGIGGIGFSESGSRLLLNFKDSDLYGVEWSKMASEPSTQYMSTELQTQFTHIQTRSWPDPYAQALRDSLIGAGTFETPAAPTTTAPVEAADVDEDEESEEDLFLRSALALLGGSSSRDEAQTEEGGDIIDRLATVMRANRNNRPTGMTAAARRAELQSAAARTTDTLNADEPIVCYKGRKNSVTMFKEATFLFEDQYVATGGDDGHVYFWEAETARLVHKIRCDRSIVNGVLYSSRLPTTLVACGIDSDAKVVKPYGNYLASTVTVRIPKDHTSKEPTGSVADSESARNVPTTVLVGSGSASSDESHRSTINALLASQLDLSIDGTPFRSSNARGLNEEHRNINTIRATARRLRGFFGTNLDADPLVESEEVDPLTRRFEADNDDDANDNPSNSDSEFDEWIVSNAEEAEENENENDWVEELEGSIAGDALARDGSDVEEQDQNEDLSDEAEEDNGDEVEEIHDTTSPEELEEAESVEEQESENENEEFESEEWETYEEEETLETERDSDSDTALDDNDREGHAGLGWSASERARHLLLRYTSSEFAPKYFFEWPQIQFSLYNAHLLDKYVMQHLLYDHSNCNQEDSQPRLGVHDNVIPAIKFIIDDRNKLLRWLPSPPLRQEAIAERVKLDYQQHVIPFETKLREFCGNGEAIKSLISPSQSGTTLATDWTQQIDAVDLSCGFIPQGLFQNNFLHDFALFYQHFEKMYGSLRPILEEITAKQHVADSLLELPQSIDPTSAVASGVAKSASVEYLPFLSGKCPPDSKNKAQNSTTPHGTEDCLTEVIPNNSFSSEEEQRPDLIIEKFLENCKTILEEVIRLLAVLKYRDGFKIDLCWESVEYGALLNSGEATRGSSSVLNLPRLATIAERSNFWPSQTFEVQKIKSLLDLLDDYLKPAIRLPCCSSLRSAKLLFFVSLHAELKLYFSVMIARLPEVYEHLIFVRKLISHFEIPSLTRPLLAPRTNPTKELLEKLDSLSSTTTTSYASPFCDARFSSEHKLPFGTSTLACEALFLKCLLRDPHHEGLPEYFAPASVQRSVRQHLLRLGTDNSSRENMPETDGDERLSCLEFYVGSRGSVIKKLLQPFVDEGSLTNIFERPLL